MISFQSAFRDFCLGDADGKRGKAWLELVEQEVDASAGRAGGLGMESVFEDGASDGSCTSEGSDLLSAER